ncbi:MAG TPA: YHYH protein [Candidatus Saccharimonadales bacterium]|nr:YHYH protein [Candidatus Saccharimonadales bacterium]
MDDITPPQNTETEQPTPVTAPEVTPTGTVNSAPPSPKGKRTGLIIGLAVLVIIVAAGAWFLGRSSNKPAASTNTSKTSSSSNKSNSSTQGLQLDTKKNYGNKYADGILPVGDSKYTTTGPKVGYGYVCSNYATNLQQDSGGAMTRGPWFTNNNTEYDTNKKSHVNGSVMWQADFTNTVSGSTRTIVTNDLPSHPTGIFPIASSDPAYAYDRNPNTIKGQAFTYSLNASPSYSSTPNCIGGEVGIMLTGVALFSAFDAGGRDAGAWEVQDSCDGHPQSDGIYHYHTLSTCIKDAGVSTVIGFALDGFPITGPKVGTNNYLTTSDLDECHGLTSQITLDGKKVTSYHYVMTEDFPYSISCYRGTAIQPPGQANAQASGQTTGAKGGPGPRGGIH